MSEFGSGFHKAEDDIAGDNWETWIEDRSKAGIGEIEALLAKHLAFLDFLDSQVEVVPVPINNSEAADFPHQKAA